MELYGIKEIDDITLIFSNNTSFLINYAKSINYSFTKGQVKINITMPLLSEGLREHIFYHELTTVSCTSLFRRCSDGKDVEDTFKLAGRRQNWIATLQYSNDTQGNPQDLYLTLILEEE